MADDGYSASDIIKYYYGSDMFINSTNEVAGVPSSWPGFNLSNGMTSPKIKQMQSQLNVISTGYPLIPKVSEDGVFGPGTENAVKVFQEVFGLPNNGIVDFPTWYKISEIYVAVSRIAELR